MKFKNTYLEKEYKKIHKEFMKACKDLPQFWTKMPVPKDVNLVLERNFPKKHYANAYYFEGWPIRDVIEQAMIIGYALGSKLKSYKKQEKKINKLAKKLDKFKFKVKGSEREFYGVGMQKVFEKDGKVVYKKHDQDFTANVSLIDFYKAWKLWEKNMLKSSSTFKS